MRTKLKSRHPSTTTKIQWTSPSGPDQNLIVTYGFDDEGRVREAFCASFRASSDICALANDACILFSRLLQYRDDLESIVNSLGEDRQEGSKSGPPSSLIGAIARKALEIEQNS